MGAKEKRDQAIARQQELINAAKAGNRDMTAEEQREFEDLQKSIDKLTAQIEAEEASEKAVAAERTRISEISNLCKSFGIDPADYIANGTSLEEARAAVLETLKKTQAPIPQRGVEVTRDEEDKVRAAAVDGLMMRSGVEVKAPTDGANRYRNISLRDLAIECLIREGGNANELIHRTNDDLYAELSRQFYNPTAAFPAILDQTVKKSIVELYNKVPTTFQEFTTKGSLPDFKTTADHEYLIGGLGDFELVAEGGEIKADKPRTELLPQRKLDTYGKQFSMTRQAFINDDIGFITKMPGLYATSAKKTIEKQVYGILFNNSAIYDGKQLFCNDHKNLIATGSAPSQQAIQEMILQMQRQTDPFGDPIYMTPRKLIVPVGYEFYLAVIFGSAQVPGSGNNDINPLYNYPLQIIQSPLLNALAGQNACPWFMVADESSARGIHIDYLNGNETPTVRRMETVGQLGFTWDIWFDWGITVRDFRGLVKNPGATL